MFRWTVSLFFLERSQAGCVPDRHDRTPPPELVCDFVSRVDVHREDDELDRLVRILEVVLRQFDCLFDLGL